MSKVKFDEGRLAKVLLSPVISEKSTFVGEKYNQSVFKVMRDATKAEVKAAIELLFKVDVVAVNVVNVRGKVKRFGGRAGRCDHAKKAYVSLRAGQELQLGGGV
jgi:large subunit ribosomal protein L23